MSGINVRKLKMIACILSGLASAVGAILITSRLTAANYTSGAGTDFDATIACLIGGVTTVGGKGGMVQIFVGVMIYGLITNICICSPTNDSPDHRTGSLSISATIQKGWLT